MASYKCYVLATFSERVVDFLSLQFEIL